MIQIIVLIFLAVVVGVVSYIFGLTRADRRPALTGAEKRVIHHHLTKAAEAARVDSQALQQVGFDQPAIIDRASDLEALAEKINNL